MQTGQGSDPIQCVLRRGYAKIVELPDSGFISISFFWQPLKPGSRPQPILVRAGASSEEGPVGAWTSGDGHDGGEWSACFCVFRLAKSPNAQVSVLSSPPIPQPRWRQDYCVQPVL